MAGIAARNLSRAAFTTVTSKAWNPTIPLFQQVKFCTTNNTSPNDKFKELVNRNKVVVFMKGVPEQPMCGFSNAVVQILRMHGVQYDSHNVLADEGIRQGNQEGKF